MRHLKSFLFAIFAGFCIGFGGLLNLMCRSYGQPIVGSIIFSVGLLLICFFGFNLFTGKVGFFFEKENKKKYLIDLAIYYIGNFVGAVGFGYLMRSITSISDKTSELNKVVADLGAHKLDRLQGMTIGTEWYVLFILSIFCGLLVFMAVELYRRDNLSVVIKVLGIIICIGGFVLAGFEHCIADMFYLSASGYLFSSYTGSAFASILLGSSGNIAGAFIGWFVINHIGKIKEN